MPQIYITDTRDIDIQGAHISSHISAARIKCTSKYTSDEAKRGSYAVELLLRYALIRNGFSETEAERIAYGANGKPYFTGIPLHFSLSHSKNYSMCAISICDIGVDVEQLRDISPSLAARILCAKDTERRPIYAWSGKEAYLKLSGEGLSGDIKLHDLGVCKDRVTVGDVKQAYLEQWSEYNMVFSVCAYDNAPIQKETPTTEALLSALNAN